MVEKRIKDIYKEYYEEDVDYAVLKHRYNQYMLEKEEEIRAHIQKIMTLKPVLNMSVPEIILILEWQIKLIYQLLQGLLDKVNELKISKRSSIP